MSLKCSILGHRFDETSVERERDEEGTEVVVTVTEIETCSRCGESRVVSENKEVTALDAPGDEGEREQERERDRKEGRTHVPGAVEDTTPADEDAEILDGDDAGSDTEEAGSVDTGSPEGNVTGIPDAEDGGTTPADDDAEIIDADEQPGEEPDQETTDEPVPENAPGTSPEDDPETTDEGTTVSGEGVGSWPEETRGEVEKPDGTAEWPDDADREGGTVVDPSVEPGGEWPEETKRDPGADPAADGPDLEPTEGPTVTVPEGMFKCSECGFTTDVEASSLRAGDFCPECHRGTLVQDTGGE